MIQRQQTLWLILATIAALLTFMFPFVIGKGLDKGITVDKSLTAGSDFLLLIATAASMIVSAVTIFLYKDRKLQIKLCVVGLLISIAIIVLYITTMQQLTNTTLALSAILPFLIPIGYFMALRNIRKDEKLIKSLDKLR
jgi:Domain of unknown function (DUF4293)